MRANSILRVALLQISLQHVLRIWAKEGTAQQRQDNLAKQMRLMQQGNNKIFMLFEEPSHLQYIDLSCYCLKRNDSQRLPPRGITSERVA